MSSNPLTPASTMIPASTIYSSAYYTPGLLKTTGAMNGSYVTILPSSRLIRYKDSSLDLIPITLGERVGEKLLRPLIDKVADKFTRFSSYIASFAQYLPSFPSLPGAYAEPIDPVSREFLNPPKITSKWKLAQRLTSRSQAPEQALKAIFTGIIQSLEEISKTKFEASITDRVWDKVSGDRLQTLKETLFREVCEQILGSFSEEDATTMLEELIRTGAIKDMYYSGEIEIAFSLSKSSIIDAIKKKAISMEDTWIPQIISAIKSEGIELPDPKTTETILNPASQKPSPRNNAASLHRDLLNAAKLGDIKKLRKALAAGARPNGIQLDGARLDPRLDPGLTPGAQMTVQSHMGDPDVPLLAAINSGCVQCCQELINAGADVDALYQGIGAVTPLTRACSEGNLEIVNLLLDARANPNKYADFSPLYLAVPYPSIVQSLINKGANPNLPTGLNPALEKKQASSRCGSKRKCRFCANFTRRRSKFKRSRPPW